MPVEDCLRPQRRYAHLFGTAPRPDIVARIQTMADRNIRRFGLVDEVPGEVPGDELDNVGD